MALRRCLYLAVMAGLLVFYWAYREWLSGLFLALMAALPWFSLLVSLPAMLTSRIQLHCPPSASAREQAEITVAEAGRLPQPRTQCKLLVTNVMTGQVWKLRPGDSLPTDHCGQLLVEAKKVRVLDYLNLIRLPARKPVPASVLVRPAAVPVDTPPDVTRFMADTFKPKPGGGFAENHELRLYRPGDHLRQVHWKLSAKTGKLIIREPMEPVPGRVLVTMILRGSPETLDRKLGQLLWISRYLLSHELPHVIHCLTGTGPEAFQITGEDTLLDAVDALLCMPQAPAEAGAPYIASSWHYHVGGDAGES